MARDANLEMYLADLLAVVRDPDSRDRIEATVRARWEFNRARENDRVVIFVNSFESGEVGGRDATVNARG